MLKHKSKGELLEIVYKLENEKNGMIDCFEKQTKVLKEISKAINPNVNIFIKIINFFVSPFLLAAVLKENKEYFYSTQNKQMKKLTEAEYLEAYSKIAQYEKKDGITPLAYKDYFSKVLQLKGVCDTCGDVMQRLHNDFQKRINKEAKQAFPYLIKPIAFKSAKYSSNGFTESVPMMCFADLKATISLLKRDIEGFGATGLKSQVALLAEDVKALESYIDEKLNGVNTPDESEQSDAFKESEAEENAVNEVSAEEAIKTHDESTKEEVEEVIETPIKTEEGKPEYSNEIAKGMKEKGLSNEEIGDYFGVSETTIRRRMKKFEDEK